MPAPRLAALLGATVLTLAGAVGSAAPAQAAGHDGYCTTDTGVTVVVDFQDLGGGVVIRCATSLPSGGTGLDALKAAGISYEGVRRWGDGFICRLFGSPAVDQGLDVEGRPGYREQCVDTPPSTAYWGYWSAPNGGSWQYSSYGVKNRRAVVGGFEGWSFSLNTTASSSPAPRVTPTRPAAPRPPADPPTSTAAVGSTSGGAPQNPAGAGASAPGGSGETPGQPGSGSPTDGTTDGDGTNGTAANGTGTNDTATNGNGAQPNSTATVAPSLAATEPPTATATTDGLVVDSDQLVAEATADGDDGTSPTTLVGAALLAFLVVAAAGTAWRRRRE